jgi:hypothetical protein
VLPNEVHTGLKQLDFVNHRLHTDVEFKLTVKQLIHANLIIVSILSGLVVFIFVCYKHLLNQRLWFLIAISVWVVCLSAFIHRKQEGSRILPYKSHTDSDGTLVIDEWVYRGMSIYQWEGYLFSGTVTAVGLCFVMIINTPHYVKN